MVACAFGLPGGSLGILLFLRKKKEQRRKQEQGQQRQQLDMRLQWREGCEPLTFSLARMSFTCEDWDELQTHMAKDFVEPAKLMCKGPRIVETLGSLSGRIVLQSTIILKPSSLNCSKKESDGTEETAQSGLKHVQTLDSTGGRELGERWSEKDSGIASIHKN
jgi:hypothetical protein